MRKSGGKNKGIPHPSWSKTAEWNVAGGLFYVLPHTTLFPRSNYYSNVPRHNKSFPGNAAFFILRRRSRGGYFPAPFPSCQLPEIVGGGAELITDDCSRYSDGQSFRALSLWASHPDFYIYIFFNLPSLSGDFLRATSHLGGASQSLCKSCDVAC